jgi:type I restriction enzyme R subunit
MLVLLPADDLDQPSGHGSSAPIGSPSLPGCPLSPDVRQEPVPMPLNETETCDRYITPALLAAGWSSTDQISRERQFTAGKIVVAGTTARRLERKRYDYLLRYTRDLPLAVVEAKAYDLPADTGLQQAMEYAQILGLSFAYATNGREFIEHDFITGIEKRLAMTDFPSPAVLWARLNQPKKLAPATEKVVVSPGFNDPSRSPRYYQTTAINRTVEAIANGKERVLLTLATGTGKSFIAFQICFRLWEARWNRKGTPSRPKILYLADRNLLLDRPMEQEFRPFGDARHKIEGEAVKSREMYFATYQQIAKDESRPGLYREYAPDFFDLIVIDECHRGSARDDSNWREILDHFTGAAKLGMTATPLRQDNRDTYAYFGKALVTYSLRQGIEDGFLAPFKVRRVVTDADDAGWRPEPGQRDRYGEVIPDGVYATPDFERTIVLPDRTEVIARYLTRFLKKTDRFGKMIVFCVDQEHASNMRRALANQNDDLVKQYPDYVCRVTSDEGDIGRKHFDNFQDVDRQTPAILTTSEMLTTGVDAPTVKNIAICRVINSMTTFKQVVGRGTRVREDYGKLWFTILDFTGSATRNFADPEFDGDPIDEGEEDVRGEPVVDMEGRGELSLRRSSYPPSGDPPNLVISDSSRPPGPRKYYVDDAQVEILAELVYELDADGRRLRTVSLTDYAGEKVRNLYRSISELRAKWTDPKYRDDVRRELEDRGIDLSDLASRTPQPDADPFDILCYVAFSAPLKSRRERAEAARKKSGFWERYTPEAKAVLSAILDKYSEYGVDQLAVPAVLEVPPISEMGNVIELAGRFGGAREMGEAISELQTILYAG